MSETRCFDCFSEFAPDAMRFAVLKKMRDAPLCDDPTEARLLESMQFDQVFVCVYCAGWYGDHAIAVEPHEATIP